MTGFVKLVFDGYLFFLIYCFEFVFGTGGNSYLKSDFGPSSLMGRVGFCSNEASLEGGFFFGGGTLDADSLLGVVVIFEAGLFLLPKKAEMGS